MTAPHVVRLNGRVPAYQSSHPPVKKFSVFFRKALATTCSALGAFAGCAATSMSEQSSPYWRRVWRNVSKPISTSNFESPPSDAPQIKKAHAVKWTQFAGRPAVGLRRLAALTRPQADDFWTSPPVPAERQELALLGRNQRNDRLLPKD